MREMLKMSKRRKNIASRVVAFVMILAMMMPMLPMMEVEAGDPGLVGTKSVVYNQATLYDYSDQYHKDGSLRTLDLIEGKGDLNEATREAAYATDPNATVWEGLYFGSGNQSIETKEIEPYEVVANMADNFSVYQHSTDSQYEQLTTDRLWNGNLQDKAWTTWTGSGETSGYIELRNTNGQGVNQFNIYFARENNANCFYPTTDNISISYRKYGDERNTTVSSENINVEEADGYVVFKVQLSAVTSITRFRIDVSQDDGKYIMLSEIEMFGNEMETIDTVSKNLAGYNIWAGNGYWGGQTGMRAYVYSGLAKEQLINGQIQFNVPDGGIFNSDTANKDVYTNVGVPFVYDSETGYYEFNAGPAEYGGYGVHFDANYDGTISNAEQSSGSNLVLDSNHFMAYDTVNSNYGPNTDNIEGQEHAGDGIGGFFPFNSPQQITKAADEDEFDEKAENALYHFGMNMSVDFTMTENGTVENTENGTPVTFEFNGDDDVWVYIDGQLVLDLGGIHDSVSAKIDFAANEITMWSTNSAYGSGDLNTASGIGGSEEAGTVTSLGQILNSEAGVGKIAKSYETFAGEGEHTLTIYYLERGRGESNCKIKYNLPRVDTLSVSKHIQLDPNEKEAITETEWAALNALDFRMRVLNEDGTAVTGKYALYDSAVYVGSYSTDEEGYFTLKNNQTAKFTRELGNSYTVEEVALENDLPASIWKSAYWTGTFSSTLTTEGNTSANPNALQSSTTLNNAIDDANDANNTRALKYTVNVLSDKEAIDTLSVNCTNYISRPFVSVTGETIVIDYGHPVKIDIMANDVQSSGEEFRIAALSEPKYGTVKVVDANGAEVSAGKYQNENGYYYLKYSLNTYMSDIEKIEYTYTLDNDQGTIKAVATVIPATSMYYEENFLNSEGTNYIKFSTATGFTEFSATATVPEVYQEPGVVGDITDSTYGTDKLYLTGTTDSNGTSYEADTTNGPAAFQYTFTGTGTAFFARTSEKSAYLRVNVKSADGTYNTTEFIDTKYAVTGKELFNIPVFNVENLGYDTYTVTVTAAKPAQWYTNQNEFYLDGVRVYEPIDMSADSEYAEYSTVYAAYEKDLEADAIVNTLREYMLDTQTGGTETGWADAEWTEASQIMFTDSNDEIVLASDYESYGPKQELYMTADQSIRFVLKDWFDDKPTNAKLYIGAKVPEGTAGTFTVNGETYNIKNTTDCYYDITSAVKSISSQGFNGLVVIEVKSGLISFTNLKCTGYVEFSLAGMDEDVSGDEGEGSDVEGDGSEDEGIEEQTVFTLLRRSISEDVTVEEPDTEEPDVETEPETPEVPEEDVETEDIGSSENESSIITVVENIVNTIVSAVKSLLQKWFRW